MEISRLKSRIAELDSLNFVLQDQTSRQMENENMTIREIQSLLDKSEMEAKRASDKHRSAEESNLLLAAKNKNLEREILSLNDIVYSKERNMNDLNNKLEMISINHNDKISKLTSMISNLEQELMEEKNNSTATVVEYKKQINDIKKDIEIKVPMLTNDIMKQSESFFKSQCDEEISALQSHYSKAIEKYKSELSALSNNSKLLENKFLSQISNNKSEMENMARRNELLELRYRELENEMEKQKHISNASAISNLMSGDRNSSQYNYRVSSGSNMQNAAQFVGMEKKERNYWSKGSSDGAPMHDGARQGQQGFSSRDRETLDMKASMQSSANTDAEEYTNFAVNSITQQLADMRKQLNSTLNTTHLRSERYANAPNFYPESRSYEASRRESSQTSSVPVEAKSQQSLLGNSRNVSFNTPTKGTGRNLSDQRHHVVSEGSDVSMDQYSNNTNTRNDNSRQYQHATYRDENMASISEADYHESLFYSPPRKSPIKDMYVEKIQVLKRAGDLEEVEYGKRGVGSNESYQSSKDVHATSPFSLNASSSSAHGGMKGNSSSSRNAHGYHNISDDFSGGYHEGYWKSKYLK